ncbi:MAG: hypothetical protein ACKOPT_16470 [Cyanobium sp.]
MSGNILLVLTPLRQALERIDRKVRPLLATPELLETEEGEDLLDVICMQFTAEGEAIKRIDKLKPGWLDESCPQIDWKDRARAAKIVRQQRKTRLRTRKRRQPRPGST